jgi:hypothetical protein
MAFTRNHINAFVIVGGDSDFMALVEKLKQYDKKDLVVGGRSFTSTILQKNCHEFIAYENLIAAPQASSRRPAERAKSTGPGDASLSKALPLVRRALKVLSDREVSPQLGLLKSTLLQLDSTFTERDYGASTFRDFIEKMAAAGYVHLKQVDRSLLVELKDREGAVAAEEEEQPQPGVEPVAAAAAAAGPAVVSFPTATAPSSPSPAQSEEGVKALFDAFQNAKNPPHWPMYLRNVKQYVKNAAPSYDERRYGFANFLEAVRAAGRAGLFRLERNRQGILRIFAGNHFPRPTPAPIFDIETELAAAAAAEQAAESAPVVEEVAPVVEEVSPVIVEELPVAEEVPAEEPKPAAAKRRPRLASTSAKKRPAPARKPRKKSGTDSEPV